MKYMSNLALAFYRRQSQSSRRESIISSTNSTVSSHEAEERVQRRVSFHDNQFDNNQFQETDAQQNSFPMSANGLVGNRIDMNLSSCNDVTIDSKNPAFILSDENVKFSEKTLFVLGQKWCWGLILLAILLISFSNTLLIILWSKQQIDFYESREKMGLQPAKMGLTALELPVDKVIVTDTEDEAESCTTREDCIKRIRRLQEIAFENGLKDIPYNFLIGDDGRTYEGRGFHFEGEIVGSNNVIDTGLVIAFIGTFTDHAPSQQQNATFNGFLGNILNREALTSNYTMIPEGPNGPVSGIVDVIGGSDRYHPLTKVFTRSQWGAESPKDAARMIMFNLPITKIFFGQIDPDETENFLCSTLEECSKTLKNIQERDFSLGYNDIEFNFLISSFGILDGRGWDVRPELPLDVDSLTIGFFTDYLYKPGEMLNGTLDKLIVDGKFLGKLAEDLEMTCHENLCTDEKEVAEFTTVRSEWNADPPRSELAKLDQPVTRIIVTDTTNVVESCETKETCIQRVKTLQLLAFNDSRPDIPDNFLIGNDGNTYEGRGYVYEGEIFENESYNNLGLKITFIGNFTENPPDQTQVATFNNLLENLIKQDILVENYSLLFENQVTGSESPASQTLEALSSLEQFHALHKVILRQKWGASNSTDESKNEKFNNPVEKILVTKISSGDVDLLCSTLEECSSTLKNLQELDFALGFNDMEYNFLISSFEIFEGRGWNVRPESQTSDVNSLVVAFLTDDLFKPGALNERLNKLVADGKVLGKLTENVDITCNGSLC